jgi:argininosuccinate lyase
MVLATDLADYLVVKGVPFREAHGIISGLSDYASTNHKLFSEISLEEYRGFSMLFDEDVYEVSVESSISARNTVGGTSFKMVQQAIKLGYQKLGKQDA